MALVGGSGQGTASVVSSINFDPTIQFGQELAASSRKEQSQSAATSPKLDDSTGLSLGLGIGGGSGSGGTVSREQSAIEPTTLGTVEQSKNNKMLSYVVLGLGVLSVGTMVILTMKKKKR